MYIVAGRGKVLHHQQPRHTIVEYHLTRVSPLPIDTEIINGERTGAINCGHL